MEVAIADSAHFSLCSSLDSILSSQSFVRSPSPLLHKIEHTRSLPLSLYSPVRPRVPDLSPFPSPLNLDCALNRSSPTPKLDLRLCRRRLPPLLCRNLRIPHGEKSADWRIAGGREGGCRFPSRQRRRRRRRVPHGDSSWLHKCACGVRAGIWLKFRLGTIHA